MNKFTMFLVIGTIFVFNSCKEKNEDLDKFKSDSDYGQFAPPDAFDEDPNFAYYGAENEWNRRMFSEKASNKFYKRRGQRQLLAILDGKPDEAIDLCKKRLTDDKNDLESMFTLTIAYCKLNEIEKAYQTAINAIDKGLPFERFLAGPRDLLVPLYRHAKFKQLMEKKNIKLIHGPMLGAVTGSGARLWFRTVDESKISVNLYLSPDQNKLIQKFIGRSSKENDYTSVVKLTDLKPSTEYYYDIIIDGQKVTDKMKLKTSPPDGQRGKYRIAFGGGAGYTPEHEKVWNTILNYNPNAVLLLGDNVYIDLPQMPNEFHDYTYYRRQSRPEFRKLVENVSTYTIWDDHDAATDDIWMGPYINKPDWKLPMLKLFERNWNNPAYGTEKNPACYYNFTIGDIDFIMLDCRFYRTNPFKEKRTMLGPVQKEWLKQSLLKSKGKFKFIVSSVPWSLKAKPGSKDTWAGFEKEREEIFEFIEQNKIEGVILISADRHRSDAWKINRKNSYDFYEFMSSRLTNIHTHKLMPDALFGYNEKCSFGLLDINTSDDDPNVVYKIINLDGEVIDSLTLKSSMLKFK